MKYHLNNIDQNMTSHSHKHNNNNNQCAKYSIPASNDIYLIGNNTVILVFFKRFYDSTFMVICNVF